MPARQAIFGGTFDPPHVGHLGVAVAARDQLGSETLHVVVANDPWQKSMHRPVTPAQHRWEMAKRAFAGHEGIVLSDIEILRGGPSFTIDTVLSLEVRGQETLLVVGPEAAAGVATWHRADELADRVTLAVVHSPSDSPRGVHGWRTVSIVLPTVDVSATRVRGLLARRIRDAAVSDRQSAIEQLGEIPIGESQENEAAGLLAPSVMNYITAHGLYGV